MQVITYLIIQALKPIIFNNFLTNFLLIQMIIKIEMYKKKFNKIKGKISCMAKKTTPAKIRNIYIYNNLIQKPSKN